MASHVFSAGQSLSGNQTITSPSGIFELGFFTPGNSQNYYIGIWYKKLPPKTVVWVANRNQPVSDTSSSTLQLFQNGNLTLLVQFKTEIWSTHSMSTVSHSTVAMLLDNGNFVITYAFNSSVVIWQSFDHPTNTWLPGGKLGHNRLTKEKLSLTPWRNPQNPAPGLFPIWAGTLKDGQEIAVKRLSKHSRQGLNELKNKGILYLHHVGLLGVQHNPADRPSMPVAVVMLSGEGSLPQPQKPGFYSERDLNELEVDPSSKAFLANAVTVLLHY
ncbi:PREDICTED: G-type lectin S-receptor-like serine/threonine-protein kinase At2g19130 [Prunus mume]|uniref:G-type lectin S-receptor-like serine/threonine-protein kinase At2g19130 n=1 Tax=Prunus mume TaxID=102107 RepID=A0ABM0PWE3_PRUMU|nr:PREDICTED: G-type lectin S-receptor-like serine/threonine-protein kinase At2g19130 [Prunus mume]